MVTIMGDPEPVNQAKDEIAKKEEPVKETPKKEEKKGFFGKKKK